MKKSHWHFLLSFMILVLIATAIYAASCVPTDSGPITLWCDSCGEENTSRTVYKADRYYIQFPDSADRYEDTYGWGCCHPFAEFATVNCWPEFDTPVKSNTHWVVGY